MHPLQVTMIMSMTMMLLISALLVLVRTMPSRPGIKWWVAASSIQGLIYFFAFINFGKETDIMGTIMFFSLAMGVNLTLSIGTLLFASIPLNIKNRLFIFLAANACIISLITMGYSFIGTICFALYNASTLVHCAYKISRAGDSQINFKFTAALIVAIAIHWMDYPILSQIEWFVPIGFVIGMFLLAMIFITLATLALLQFKIQTQDSERRAIEAATHDSLTGLYNRSYLTTLFDNYVKEAEQIERSFILLYFDLDGFKKINDTHGHKVGDLILKTVAKRMSEWLGTKGDAIRIGGDELVVLTRLRSQYERKNAETAAQRLLNEIEKPIVDGNDTYSISSSIGACCYGEPLTELEDMLNRADKLMYDAKNSKQKNIFVLKPVTEAPANEETNDDQAHNIV